MSTPGGSPGPDVLGELGHWLSLDGRDPDPAFDYDAGEARNAHPTHDIESGACRRCGLRAHWPGVEARCRGKRARGPGVHLRDVSGLLALAVRAFAADWQTHEDRPEALPSLDEWIAELIEFRRSRR